MCLIDTGATVSVFDETVAELLDLDLENKEIVTVRGIGGGREVRMAEVELQLLDEPGLSTLLEVAFAPDVEVTFGDLIGLDVLAAFKFALDHARRTGYLSPNHP